MKTTYLNWVAEQTFILTEVSFMFSFEFLIELAHEYVLTAEQKETFLERFGSQKSEQDIANKLRISLQSYRSRMTGIYKKFGIEGRVSGKSQKLLDIVNSKYQEFQSNKLDKSNLWRIKTAMVLYALERALGAFVCSEKKEISDLPAGIIKTIQEREQKKGRSLNGLATADDVVAATYLDEVFNLAIDTSKGRPEEECLSRLKKLFEVLDIFSIRNAVCHPNKDFHPSYWYRVAAISTDPAIFKLKFQDVYKAFGDAEAERISSPPKEWLEQLPWQIPNNLPKRFEHDITSLIGRSNELKELKKNIQNKRHNLIAILAPGGLGKTAILLEVLRDIAYSSPSGLVDRILYFSSKTEILTANGVITETPSVIDIESLRKSITSTLIKEGVLEDSLTFEDVCQAFNYEKILLCLDNLETILVDEPESFDQFYNELPEMWRLIVTTRITVNSATIFSLQPLSNQGAQDLARNYLLKRSGERLNESVLKKIADTCNSNPLAIRLTIDAFIAGKSLDEILSVAKQQVLDFSYKNLIDALSPVAHEVLECLFVLSEPVSKARAVTLLQKNYDEITEAFHQLRGTSLVTRIQELTEEFYTLSSSVRAEGVTSAL